jgi:hypothetical protein
MRNGRFLCAEAGEPHEQDGPTARAPGTGAAGAGQAARTALNANASSADVSRGIYTADTRGGPRLDQSMMDLPNAAVLGRRSRGASGRGPRGAEPRHDGGCDGGAGGERRARRRTASRSAPAPGTPPCR